MMKCTILKLYFINWASVDAVKINQKKNCFLEFLESMKIPTKVFDTALDELLLFLKTFLVYALF